MMKKYIPSQIEPKWQKRWEEDKLYAVDLDKPKKKYYLLVEFTYPSGDLHIGHWFAFAVPDVLGRMKRMQGYNVFFPNGFDAFGLPAENAAIQRGVHPKDWTISNIENMRKQFTLMGAIHDWNNQVITCLPDYYKWNQWIFLKMLKKGLAYKGKALANWCPSCQTVLANENVEAGKCWRCATVVVQKEVEQWFLKITEYADRLLWSEKPDVDWPKPIREGQNNWIGKSEGMDITFQVDGSKDRIVTYTVFPETIFGVTYMVLAPEHTLVENLTTKDNKNLVKNYIKKTKSKSELERTSLEKEKTGVFTGSYCINPVNGKKVPIWVADYVIGTYGTGAVMGVPGSDHRDFEFAQKYDLEIIRVIGKSADDDSPVKNQSDVLEEGIIVNSAQFNGLTTPEQARDRIKDWMEEKGYGKRKVQYHLHDWSISRQRYWGTPIPIIYCDNCGTVPVPEKDLPVELPYQVDYAPKGKPPLATADDWVNVKCPNCGGKAKREVETMDTFVDSSWYFLRYLDNQNEGEIAKDKRLTDWIMVDIYFGGAEHTLGHTLYSRFFVKFLKDIGILKLEEYAKKRVHHGVILGPDGARMSKSRGNVVNPDAQVKEFGADTVRLYLCFIGPYDIVAPWNPGGMHGVYHFLQRVWGLQEKLTINDERLTMNDLRMMHKIIKKVTEDIENIKFNTAVAALMEWLNYLSGKEKVGREEYKTLLLLLAPFAPHITEELWQLVRDLFTVSSNNDEPTNQLTNNWSIHQQSWPQFDKKLLEEEEFTVVVQINGKVRDNLMIQKDMINRKKAVENLAKQSPKVQKFLQGNTVKKTIYIPGKIISFVISN
ncbi:leucine--tRNA ligase [Candidatus Microgenomates bacterium]|nr:leucine--tRNA ligase [Candidatus Microgenomates bacterium]